MILHPFFSNNTISCFSFLMSSKFKSNVNISVPNVCENFEDGEIGRFYPSSDKFTAENQEIVRDLFVG